MTTEEKAAELLDSVEATLGAPPFQRRSGTSRAAASRIRAHQSTLQAKVLAVLLVHEGGLTDLEMQDRLAMKGSTQRPRRVELQEAGLVRRVGTDRAPSGRKAAVWDVKPWVKDALQ